MSVQLIVYPQSYNGFYNSTSYPITTAYITNGNFFQLGQTSAYGYNGTQGNQNFALQNLAITAQPPTAPNTWYRYHTTGGSYYASIAAPQNVGGYKCYFSGAYVTQPNASGVYMRVTGLTPGTQYTVGFGIDTNDDGQLYLNVLDPTTYNLISGSNPNPIYFTSTSTTFNSPGTEVVVAIEWEGWWDGVGQTCTISNVKMFETQNPQSLVYTDLADGQVICDLYEDENIPLTLSVDEFKNALEQRQSYSKAFNLPATKRNNQIFNEMFEVTRTSQNTLTWNPYIKTQCILKQDGFTLFEGYLTMLDATDKEGEISYNVNLFSETIALADILKDKTFNNLDFYELEHSYNYTNISNSWDSTGSGIAYLNANTSGFRNVNDTLKYPFCDWNHQMLVSDGSHVSAGHPQLTNLEQAFRPFIQLKYLIDRIFDETNVFSYSSTLFNSEDFKKLYMDFNWGSEEFGSSESFPNYLKRKFNLSPDFYINQTSFNANSYLKFDVTDSGDATHWNTTYNRYVSPTNNWNVTCDYYIKLESDATTTSYSNNTRIAKFNSAGQWLETFVQNDSSISAGGNKIMQGTFQTVLQTGEYIQAQSKTLTTNKIRMGNDTPASFLQFNSENESEQVYILLNKLRGDIGQWEFLKGIMTMFNLIAIPDPDSPNVIQIESYPTIFLNNIASKQLNWTDKIDVSEIKLQPLLDLPKRTVFKFVEDSSDYAFNLYKREVQGHLYGSKIADEINATALSGSEEIIPEPFAATISKPLHHYWDDLIVPSIYSLGDDGTTKGFANSPRILYDNGKQPTSTYWIPPQNGLSGVASLNFGQFSHLSEIPTTVSAPPQGTDTRDFHFGQCQLITPLMGNPANNNLFNLYWAPYYNELYNVDTRMMTIKVNLSPADINTFNFYDTVIIKNREFRVNKIDYKPNDLSTVEFILIP